MQNVHDAVTAAAKTTPPVMVSAMAATGIGLSDVLIVITIFYTIAQSWFLIRDKWIRDPMRIRPPKENKENEE